MGKVGDVVLCEVPAHDHPARDHRRLVAMATLAEVLAHVLTVAKAFNETCTSRLKESHL